MPYTVSSLPMWEIHACTELLWVNDGAFKDLGFILYLGVSDQYLCN